MYAWIKLNYRSHTLCCFAAKLSLKHQKFEEEKNRKVYYIQNKLIYVS